LIKARQQKIRSRTRNKAPGSSNGGEKKRYIPGLQGKESKVWTQTIATAKYRKIRRNERV